ncbi:hypothetical protein HDU76_008558, partial [Blyttiomyces sp. JEL0837]
DDDDGRSDNSREAERAESRSPEKDGSDGDEESQDERTVTDAGDSDAENEHGHETTPVAYEKRTRSGVAAAAAAAAAASNPSSSSASVSGHVPIATTTSSSALPPLPSGATITSLGTGAAPSTPMNKFDEERRRSFKRTCNMIWGKISDHRYGNDISSTEEFHRDILLMCANAIMFYDEDSEMYQMAVTMRKYCEQEVNAMHNARRMSVSGSSEDSIEPQL